MNIGPFSLLAIIFAIAKLMGVITWSWWVILIPLYPAILMWLFIIVMFIFGIIGTILRCLD